MISDMTDGSESAAWRTHSALAPFSRPPDETTLTKEIRLTSSMCSLRRLYVDKRMPTEEYRTFFCSNLFSTYSCIKPIN